LVELAHRRLEMLGLCMLHFVFPFFVEDSLKIIEKSSNYAVFVYTLEVGV